MKSVQIRGLFFLLLQLNCSVRCMEMQLQQPHEIAGVRAKIFLELGKTHIKSKKYEKAKECFEEAAKQEVDKESSAWACMHLAKLYYFGRGVEKDRDKAFAYVGEGCLKGKETPARYELQAFTEIFLNECLNVHGTGKDGRPLLFTPVVKRYPEVVQLLLDKGANPNASDNNGSTVLHYASSADTGGKEIVELLLENGADKRALGCLGCTVLHWAATGGNVEIVRFLLLRGADLKAVDNLGNTVLHEAAESGSKETIELLIAEGANPKAVNREGRTALHVAAAWADKQLIGDSSWGDKEVVELLLAKGVDAQAVDMEGKTAYDIATNDEIKELLKCF